MSLRVLVASFVVLAMGCGGPSAACPPSPRPDSSAVVVPIVQPPPRARDDESDAFGPTGRNGSAPTKPSVECPDGARFNGTVCVVSEVTCPAGSHRVRNTCIGDVTCPSGAVWDGDTCRPSVASATPSGTAPSSLAAPPPNGCFFDINSIPASHVLIDGVSVGWTPRLHAPVSVGTHTVVFVADQGKKSVTASCAAGETKAVLVKFQQGDPGY